MKNMGKTLLTRIIVCVLVCATVLGANLGFVQAAQETKAKYTPPAETNAFVDNYYVEPINQDAPFFDVILPQIAANIEEYNTHSVTPYYDEFPKANNPENFQGLGSTTYANINGEIVTAEAFYRLPNEGLNDPNCGMGLLIYQCIEYKRKHPEEDVKLTFSSYRTSVTASVCVIPESKYYGYMRSLYGTNYDEQGFVRISYMLTEAARMGIEVTLVNQYPSYAVSQYNPATNSRKSRSHLNFKTYYNQALKSDCYDSYEPGKKVSDFMTFTVVDWALDDKGADMQHVKSATASHYLATDGTEHKNAVFFSSSNLDENNYRGANGNNGSQSGVIISDHEDIYRVTYNYTQLMVDYKYQEGINELRKIVKEKSEEQIELFNSGREDEIAKDEQLVYLGGEDDPVFELYFTPFGGTVEAWDLTYNPVAKYVNKLGYSEDYVEFMYNVGFSGETAMTVSLYDVLKKAYCENPNVNNKIHIRADGFGIEEIENLELGREIGYCSIVGSSSGIHSKDFLVSYVENGVRHRVSLMTSANWGAGPFYYRTNSLLVINETEKTGGDFYGIYAERFGYGMLDHDLMATPSNLMISKGETYKLNVTQNTSDKLTWTTSNSSVATVSGGKVKGVAPGTATITVTDQSGNKSSVKVTVVKCLDCRNKEGGQTFNYDEQYVLKNKLSTTPVTFEAEFTVNKSDLLSVNTLLGSDGNYDPGISYALNSSGQPRVMIRDVANTANKNTYTFKNVKVATGEKVHLAIVTDFSAKKMYCYVDGKLKQTISISAAKSFTDKHNLVIGGDHRSGNARYFPGEIHSIAVWSDKRTAAEITADVSGGIDTSDANLMAAYDLNACEKCMVQDLSKNNNDLNYVKLWLDEEEVAPVGNYDYSFAVIGDTQTLCQKYPDVMDKLYDWVVDNKKSQKIEYVIGLGDITEKSTDVEWADAKEAIGKLDGEIPYMLVRGNHDTKDGFNTAFNNGVYENTIEGVMTAGDLTNSYRTFSVQGTDYLFISMDFGADDATLQWIDSVLKKFPKHKAIIATHAYMYRDGTTIDAGDLYPPSHYTAYPGALNGDEVWEKYFSKHENLVMVLSGHDPWQTIVYRQDEGANGNTVTQMLIDAQYVDNFMGPSAMVAMFYFSENGEKLTVRWYSVEKECYGNAASQFTVDLEKELHTYKTTTTKATLSKNGKVTNKCAVCGEVVSSKAVYAPETFTLSTTEYTYDGKVKTPFVTVKDNKGYTLKKDTDYTVSYDSGRKNPGKYSVKVTFKGNYSGSKTLSFTIYPKAPASAKAASAGHSSIKVSWNKVTGASGYTIYRATSKNGKYSAIKHTTSTSYTNYSRTTGKTYYYKVRAYVTVSGKKVYGSYSSIVSAVPVPAVAKNVKASSANTSLTSIKTSWSKVSGASGYTVYRATSKNGTYKAIKSTSSTSYTNSGLTAGKTYYYKVRAYKNVSGKKIYGSYSSIVSAKLVPATPNVTVENSGSRKIRITWDKVSGVSGYEIYRATSKNGKYTAIKSTTSTRYTNSGLTAGTTYYYKVRAYKNVSGNKIYSDYSSVKNAKG